MRPVRPGRWKPRTWIATTALTPILLLAAALAAASGTFLTGPPRPGPAPPSPEDPRDLGATGQLPRDIRLSPELLDQAGNPRELATGAGPEADLPNGRLDIPRPVLDAYIGAASVLSRTDPQCGLDWSVLAAIGRVESGHARGGKVDVMGTTVTAILGPRLSGAPGVAAVPDTDAGRLDGDPVWDRAVGPMQFLPATWAKYAVNAHGEGPPSPHNVNDAALAAGRYLCDGSGDLRNPRDLAAAVFRYNHSDNYVRTVLIWASAYARGVTPTPAELAPEVGDVLRGERVSSDPGALAAAPGAPHPAAPPSAAPPLAAAPAPPPAGAPRPSAPPPSAPAPPTGSAPPNSTSRPTSTGTRPPSSPPSSAPPSGGAPPSAGTSHPGVPPSSTPPRSEPPASSGSPATPSTPTLPGAPAWPDATTPPSTPAVPSTPTPPSTQAPPSSETSPGTRTSPSTSVPPSEPGPTSTRGTTSDRPRTSGPTARTCDPGALALGEFSRTPRSGGALAPGTGDPGTLHGGETVYVNSTGGELVPCTVEM